MDKIGNYRIIESLSETKELLICRAEQQNDTHTCLIKLLKAEHSTQGSIARFKQEYNIIKSINLESVIKAYGLIQVDAGYALILEDFKGTTLKKWLGNVSLSDIALFLKIAIKLAETLGYLHDMNIVHRDINPANILINPATYRIKLTHFALSTRFTDENRDIYNPGIIEGTLAYMSPEQTGRMNRQVDYRTDLYSLGITFYEMLSSTVPFKFNDPLELIHAHIAKKPVELAALKATVPVILSRIIMKLLSKTADERYQNSFGLMSDLMRCRQDLETRGEIAEFELATHDIPVTFIIPQLLIGREKQLDNLLENFRDVRQGSCRINFVLGDPGLGKSTLVDEIRRPIIAGRGHYISGKYDEFGRNVPYSAIIRAFRSLIRQILMEKEEIIAVWKAGILAVLKENAQVIIDVIPDLEFITGKQPHLVELDLEEARNRFHLVFRNFIKVFAMREHPLVLFLDDLQWIDSASIDLLESLVCDEQLKFFFLICACQEKTIYDSHPIRFMRDFLTRQGISYQDILLEPFSVENINQLIGILFKTDAQLTLPLARIIHNKTNGNPFFMNQFLKALHSEKIIRFDYERGWQWELEKLDSIQYTDNVAELMAGKIARLPQATLDTLKTGACIGHRFKLELLMHVLDMPMEEIMFSLQTAALEGLIAVDGNYYLFSHDRILEAVYDQIPPADKKQIHYKIGKFLLENTSEEHLTDDIFCLVNHLNQGSSLITSQQEKDILSRLNYLAGNKARETSASGSAVEYYRTAIQLLDKDCWQKNYGKTFALFKKALESEFMVGNYDEAERITKLLFENVFGKIDLSQVYSLLVMLNTNAGRPAEAIRLGIRGLKMFGVKLAEKSAQLDILLDISKITMAFRKTNIEDIVNFPEMKDPEKLAIVELLTAIAPAASTSDIHLLAQTIFKPVYYYLKYGNSRFAAWTWASFANIIGRIAGDYWKGYRVGLAALELDKKYDNRKIRNKVLLTYAYSVLHWKLHARECLPYLKSAYEYGLAAGDFYYAGSSINLACMTRIILGHNLDDICEECSKYSGFIKEIRHALTLASYKDNRQLCLCLMGKTEGEHSLDSGGYDSSSHLAMYMEEKNYLLYTMLLLNILRVQYLFKRYNEALVTADKIRKYIPSIKGILHEPEFFFYHSLTITAVYDQMDSFRKIKYRRQLAAYQKQMKIWALNCPENFLHKYQLVEAERIRISGKGRKFINKNAIRSYSRAVQSAVENEYFNNAAIAAELAAGFYMEAGMENIAQMYLVKACNAYNRWGAAARVNEMKKKYPYLLDRENIKAQEAMAQAEESYRLTLNSVEALDLFTIIKASQAISGEIVLGSLLEKMMRIIMENAGAEKAILLLMNEGQLLVEARGEINSEKIAVLESIPVNEYPDIAASVVHYVARSRQTLILGDAAAKGDFINDSYIRRQKTRSVLAFPIIKRTELSGIIYLENNLTSSAFSTERLALLTIIASQVAISIDNARLYSNLEEKVRERTGELHASHMKLKETMQELWGEMELARKIQTVLLPCEPAIPGYEISACMVPADNVGGDYYDVIEAGDRNWVVIGDVSGHGVSAGLVMMMVQTSIHNTLGQCPDLSPSELVARVNRTITANIRKLGDNKYVTMTAFAIDRNGRFTFAGMHLVLLIYRAAKGSVERVETHGVWIGLMDDISNINYDNMFVLNPGDTLLLYTDGIIEAQPVKREKNVMDEAMFELDKLEDMLCEMGREPVKKIIGSLLDELREKYLWDDDITLMAVRRL